MVIQRKDWRNIKMYRVVFSGNCGYTDIIVADKTSLDFLIRELNDKYNKNRITVTFKIECVDDEKKI
jgi:hypothetical protein